MNPGTSSGTELRVLTPQEYVLAHTEMPATLQGAEAAIKKQEDFMTTMDANEDKINGVVEAGRRLAVTGNINGERIQERVASIDDRWRSHSTHGGPIAAPRGASL